MKAVMFLHKIIRKKVFLYIVLISCYITSFYLIKNTAYLISEFLLASDTAKLMERCSRPANIECIPRIIHQIHGFKDSRLKKDHLEKTELWKKKHSDYIYYLWNATTVNKMIENEHKHLFPLFRSYGSWIQRADVARYVILYHYGGWYIDLDVRCKTGLHELAMKAHVQGKRAIFHTTFPVGTSNDLFGITPRHPFLLSVLENLPNSNRWFLTPHLNIMLTTGSTYMWGRLLNYPCQDEFKIMEKDEYKNYFQIEHDGSWHSWDDKVVLLITKFVDYRLFLFALFVLFFLAFFTCLRCKILKSTCKRNAMLKYL